MLEFCKFQIQRPLSFREKVRVRAVGQETSCHVYDLSPAAATTAIKINPAKKPTLAISLIEFAVVRFFVILLDFGLLSNRGMAGGKEQHDDQERLHCYGLKKVSMRRSRHGRACAWPATIVRHRVPDLLAFIPNP